MAAMQVVTQQTTETVQRGVRPFDLRRDLRPVARLIADAFADELDEQGKAALRELRILGHMGGLIRLLTPTSNEFQDVFNGFVWIEDGRLVGNVTVQRAANGSGRWQIANVAVDPAYRGRGIARALMQTALDYIADMGGSWAVLQVREQNEIARGLYERMGFENLGGSVEMTVARRPRVALLPRLPGLAPFSAGESNLLYDLAVSQGSPENQWWRSARRDDFYIPLEQRVGEWLNQAIGRERIIRAAVRDFKSRFEAATVITARKWRGVHQVRLWVRPEARERYEEPLILWALATLEAYPAWPVEVRLNTAQERARQALAALGFQTKTVLLTMRRSIR
ncbi:MAG: N-acetyltransferase [Caldilineae bacterium]|nr:MAG: N-acetyltransferase [Caldilineae bacterium]